jgi:hypothetical protein
LGALQRQESDVEVSPFSQVLEDFKRTGQLPSDLSFLLTFGEQRQKDFFQVVKADDRISAKLMLQENHLLLLERDDKLMTARDWARKLGLADMLALLDSFYPKNLVDIA